MTERTTKMAKWHFEVEMQTLPSGPQIPHCLIVSDHGVKIRLDYTRHWFIEYRSADLQARFDVYRDPPVDGENDLTLGPHCRVRMQPGRFSRPLERADLEPLATNVKEALRLHLQLPGSVPPKIERIRFADALLQPFDD